MPIMGVAAVAGTVIPCAVACKKGAESAKVEVVNMNQDLQGWVQFNLETEAVGDGDLEARVTWHASSSVRYYIYNIAVDIDGKIYTQYHQTRNPDGFKLIKYLNGGEGVAIRMAEKVIPNNADIKINIYLEETQYGDDVEISTAGSYYLWKSSFPEDTTTVLKNATPLTTQGDYTPFNVPADKISSWTGDIDISWGYETTRTTENDTLYCYEVDYAEVGWSFYSGMTELDWTWEDDYTIHITKPSGGWTSALSGYFYWQWSYPEDLTITVYQHPEA